MFPFQKIKDKFLNIPDDVQEAIASTEVNAQILTLTDKYKLQFDEAEELTKEIGFVMLGLKKRDDFVKNVAKVTGLDIATAQNLAQEINDTIFEGIRESLRKVHSHPEIEEDDEDLDEDSVREELLNEIANPKEKTSDLIQFPAETEEQDDGREATVSARNEAVQSSSSVSARSEVQRSDEAVSLNTSKTSNIETVKDKTSVTEPIETKQSTENPQQEPKKSYTIDPYREPIE